MARMPGESAISLCKMKHRSAGFLVKNRRNEHSSSNGQNKLKLGEPEPVFGCPRIVHEQFLWGHITCEAYAEDDGLRFGIQADFAPNQPCKSGILTGCSL